MERRHERATARVRVKPRYVPPRLIRAGGVEALGPRPPDTEGILLAGRGDHGRVASESLSLIVGDRERLRIRTSTEFPLVYEAPYGLPPAANTSLTV